MSQPSSLAQLVAGAFVEHSTRQGKESHTLFLPQPNQIAAIQKFLGNGGTLTSSSTTSFNAPASKTQPATTYHGLTITEEALAALRKFQVAEVTTGSFSGEEREQLLRAAIGRIRFATENAAQLTAAINALGSVSATLRDKAWMVTAPSANGSVRLYVPESELQGVREKLASVSKGAFLNAAVDSDDPFLDAPYLQTNSPFLGAMLEKLIPASAKKLEVTEKMLKDVGTPNAEAAELKGMLDIAIEENPAFGAALEEKTYLFRPEKGLPRLVFADEATRKTVLSGLRGTPGLDDLLDVPEAAKPLQNGARDLRFASTPLSGDASHARALGVLGAALGTSRRAPSRFEEAVEVPRISGHAMVLNELIRQDHPSHPNAGVEEARVGAGRW